MSVPGPLRVGAALAQLSKGLLDAAIDEVTPVLTLAPELRISTVTAYMDKLDRKLDQSWLRGNNDATNLRRSIRDFNAAALPGSQPTSLE